MVARSSPRSPETTPRREEILDRTLEIVREVGLAKLTLRRIAERVGFTEPALFRHFSSKKALILGLMERLRTMLLDPIRALPDESDRPATVRLLQVLQHHVELIERHDSLPILLLAEASATGDAELLTAMRGIFAEYQDILRRLLDEALREPGTAGDPSAADLLALGLLGMPAALAIRHRLNPDPAFERRFRDEFLPRAVSNLTGGSR